MKTREAVPLSFLLPDWLRAPALSIATAKEVREILPYGLVSLLMTLVWLAGNPGWDQSMVWACRWVGELATVAMGAAVFGHEFTHRTLALILVQPQARSEVWWRKMRVLAVAMAVIAMVRLAGQILLGMGWNMVSWASFNLLDFTSLLSLVSVGFGLLIAPLFTLWSRSTLAGIVFTLVLPVLTWQAARLATTVWYGQEWVSADFPHSPSVSIALVLTLAQWVAGPFLAYRVFLRLQAVEPCGLALGIPWRSRRGSEAAAARPSVGHSLPRLVAKEIRLQAPAFLVTGAYLLICGADMAIRKVWPPGDAGSIQPTITALATYGYGILVSLLVGALTCAEERHAGTLPWHLTLPMPGWRQWLVKVGSALGLALLLAVGLPALVAAVDTWANPPQRVLNLQDLPSLAAGLHVLVLVTIGLYVSSVAATAIRAVLWAVPLAFVFEAVFLGILAAPPFRAALWDRFVPFETEGRSFLSPIGVLSLAFWAATAAGGWLLVLGCAFQNFRRVDSGTSRLPAHVATLLGYAVVAGAACLVFAQVIRATGITLPPTPEKVQQTLAATCDQNLKAIASAIRKWSLQHSNQLPSSLEVLTQELASPKVLVCPADPARQPAADWAKWSATNLTYEYTPLPAEAKGLPVAQLSCPIHRAVQFVSGPSPARYGTLPLPADATTSTQAPPRMDLRTMIRYGLIPQGVRLPADFEATAPTNTPGEPRAGSPER